MFVRVTTVSGAKDLDKGVALVRDKAVSVLEDQKGYRGVTVSGNPETGELGILSVWDSLADIEAGDAAIAPLRDELISTIGGTSTVARMEQVVMEVGSEPPAVGNSLRIVEVTADPSTVDEQVGWFRENVLPDLKAAPGFRAVRMMIDRKAGRAIVGSVWSDEATMHAGDDAAAARRSASKERGVEVSAPRFRKVLFMRMP